MELSVLSVHASRDSDCDFGMGLGGACRGLIVIFFAGGGPSSLRAVGIEDDSVDFGRSFSVCWGRDEEESFSFGIGVESGAGTLED
jgi:hypothetical protein